MVMTLYKLDASPPARAVMMVIEALKIPDVEYIDVNLLEGSHLSEEFTKMNPQHTVPLLKDDDFLVWDSHAIAGYLVSKYGADDSLYPTDPKKRAIVDQRLHFDSGILFPALRGSLEPVIFWGETAFRPECLEKVRKGYDFAEKFLTSTWMAGEEFTVADICCVASISTMNDIIVPIDENTYPKLSAWLERCSQLDVYKKKNAPGNDLCKDLVASKLS
uniref:Glutathione S-transferase 1 n=1 Tax=Manduca sexta TaxID=7130 RepID=GSTT1_MANSE|nr:RecName: Full=Glutathione S-transferase 1; AltName: Full=GST class-theta [Manduca sexta]AAA92880.1 glutathione S-transferase [Manduca sexta]